VLAVDLLSVLVEEVQDHLELFMAVVALVLL
jgi:hypothetical protein